MRNNYSNYLGVVTSAGASDEHPLSIHSASIRRRWHSRGMQLICTLVLLFTFAIGQMWGAAYVWDFTGAQSDTNFSSGTSYPFTSKTGDKSISYLAGSSDGIKSVSNGNYLKINGSTGASSDIINSRYFTLVAPSAAGTITIKYANVSGKTANVQLRTGTNKSILRATIKGAQDASVTSENIYGLTAGTTNIYISFLGATYIESITWTEIATPAYSSSYYSEAQNSCTTGATFARSNGSEPSGSGIHADFAKYSNLNNNATGTFTFSTALKLNSNGSNKGCIRVWYGVKTASLSINNGSPQDLPTPVNKVVNYYEYTIPDATEDISTLTFKNTGSANGGLFYAVEVLTYSAAPACSAPTDPEITGTTSYTEGEDISLTASATGATSATFTWYKGTTWEAASAESSVGTGATLSINSCATSDAGTYWCNISNGTGCEVQVSQAITVAEAPAVCEAPTSVTIAATEVDGNYGWRYSKGETIDLTCSFTGGAGTPSYQWQKLIGETWTDINTATNASAGTSRLQIADCASTDGGSYRCVVSRGTGCEKASDGYFLRIFTLNGNYDGNSWTENAIVWTDEFTGTVTLNLNQSSLYTFKVTDNNGKWFGNSDNNIILSAINWDCGINNTECHLYTGPAGNYVATINIEHAAENSPYVNVQLAYPSVTHPAEGYSYFEKPTEWTNVYLYWYTSDGNRLTDWDHTPEITTTTTICGKTYYYSPLWNKYDYVIYKGNGSHQWPGSTQLSTSGCSGKYLDKTDYDTPAWAAFSTNTISFVGNDATSGSMSDIENIACGADLTLPANAFVKTSAEFKHWTANVDVTVGDDVIAAGSAIADGATLKNISSDITLTAQWKNLPTTIFDWEKAGSTNIETDNTNLNNASYGSMTTGTSVAGRKFGTNNIEHNKSGYKLGNNDVCIEIQGTVDFAEGDTVIITGVCGGDGARCFAVAPSTTTDAVADTVLTNTQSDKSNVKVYKVVLKEEQAGTKIRVFRLAGKTMYLKTIKVIRPAVRPIASTAISLSDLKVNNRSISSDSLATLVSAKSLLLKDEYAVAPVIKFNEHKVITYSDGESPATKTTDKVYTVTATTVEGKWQASQTINEVAYTVTATKVSSAKVYYYDGSTKLGEETVAIDGSPEHAGDYDDKTLASFVGWYNNSDLAEGHKIANIAELVVTKDTTVYGKWNPTYATSANLEQWVLDHGKSYDAWAQLGAIGYAGSFTNSLDSLDDNPNKDNRNYAYLGFKVKNESGKQIDFRVANGNTVKIKFGNVTTTPLGSINGADYEAITITEGVYTYIADGADAYISIKAADNATLIFKQIMIGADPAFADVTLPWRVTYNKSTGTCATAEAIWSGAALTLPDVTPADADSTFAGWYDGDDLAGVAGASYNATKNVTLLAHFAPVEYSVTYVGGEGATGSMGPEAKGWGLEYTALANTFEKDGHVFSGWTVTGVDGVSTIPALGSFTMPKNNVTLTAIWTDNSKVAQIVETNVKYESFAAAIAAVQADQTIQLLQDCEYSTYWNLTIADTVTLDLNGKNLTYTGTLRGVQVSNGGTLVLMDGTATVAPTIDLTTSPMARTAINYTSGVFDSKDGMCALAGSEIVINSGTYLATEGVILVKGENATATVNDGVLICRDNSVVSGNGTNSADFRNYVMNIHGGILYGEIFSAGYASMVVYHPNVGTLNIDGGILVSTNGPCVVTRGGASNITGGTLVAIGDGTGKCGDASLVLPAVGVACDFKSAYPGVASTNVAISGTVDVTGEAGAVKAVYKAAEPTAAEVDAIGVSGGTFNTELTNEVCAPGFVPAPKDPVTGKYSVEPKDGVSIIKAVATNKSQDITGDKLTGIYKGAAHIETATDYKLNEGKYFMVQLEEGKNFQAGDIVKINVSAVNDCNGFTLYSSDEFIAANLIIDTHENSDAKANVSTGINEVELPNTYAGSNKLYVARADGADKYLNAGINQVEVVRVIYPTLTAISFNGVAGAIDEANKTVAVTIPYDADLAALTITKTILWNEAAATGSILINGSATGAWVEGDNTYKLTDKDGDYTVYTITLTRDVQKHAVSFNTHGGTAVASVEVVDGGYLAAAPADPTKEDYIFQYWSETEDGAEVDVTTVQIDEDKTFHAVWASDGAIKLINGDVVNHTNFLTGTNETTIEIESVDYKCVDFTTSGSNRTTVASISDLKEFIQYNATTNKAKISLSLYNTNSSAVSVYLHMLEEGSETPTTEEISVPAGEILKTNYYAFNSEKNRSFYITCGNRNYIKVLQVKVVDDGTTTLKKAGQVGYSVNTLKSRIFAPQQSAISFEGLTVNANAVCKPLSTTALKIKNNYNISFHADVDMTLAVTTEGNQTYYVSATADGTTNETSFTGRKEFEITAGDWYIHAGSSELKVAKLEFIAPKCEKPTVADMADVDLCAGEAFTALAVSASVSDEGTLHYAWFKEAGETDEAVGTDAATYTPEADGQYYVIVTNRKDNFTDNSKTSNTITVEHFAVAVITTAPENVVKEAGEEATLSVVASGKNCTYEWFACDDALGTNPVAFIPAETGTSLTVTVAGEKYYMVVVSSDCGEPVSAVAKVEEWIAYPQADVTGSITWDWTNAAWPTEGTASFKVVDGELDLLANQNSIVPVVDGVNGFRADMLLGSGQYVWRYGGADKKCFQGTELKFHTTVAGTVTVWYRSTSSGTDVKVYINGQDAGHHSTGNYTKSSTIVVPANSDVRITKEGTSYVRINKIVFNADPDYTREVSNNIGTLCVNHNVLAGGFLGATFYQIASRNELYDYKIDFEEVLPNEELKAGEPYIFQSTTGRIDLFFGETVAAEPVPVRGMIGNYGASTLAINEDNQHNILYIAQNKLWTCENLVGQNLILNEHRAYIDMTQVPTYAAYQELLQQQQNSAPGRRRVTLGTNAEQVATGFDALNADEAPVKMMIDGKLFILRGEKMYDATGRLVK